MHIDRVMDREELVHPIVDSAIAIHPDRRARLPARLKLCGSSIGFLNNWKVTRITDGIQRMIRQKR